MIMHRLAICVVLASSILVAPRPAAAAVTDFYDTIDAVEVNNLDPNAAGDRSVLTVTGILTGQTAAITRVYIFANANPPANVDMAMHCHRLAVLAMSKPGKFQYAIGPGPFSGTIAHGCKLIARTP
jgi:hypothetical protein